MIEEIRRNVIGKNGMIPKLMEVTKEMPVDSRKEMYRALIALKIAFCNGIKKMK